MLRWREAECLGLRLAVFQEFADRGPELEQPSVVIIGEFPAPRHVRRIAKLVTTMCEVEPNRDTYRSPIRHATGREQRLRVRKGNRRLSNPLEDIKGRIKEAGAVTGSASLEREGEAQQQK